jgi:predicted RNase H-like HicB family nuclease
MAKYTVVIEKCSETGDFFGYVPGFPGAHSAGETIEELKENMIEVIQMLTENGDTPKLESEFVGTTELMVA